MLGLFRDFFVVLSKRVVEEIFTINGIDEGFGDDEINKVFFGVEAVVFNGDGLLM